MHALNAELPNIVLSETSHLFQHVIAHISQVSQVSQSLTSVICSNSLHRLSGTWREDLQEMYLDYWRIMPYGICFRCIDWNIDTTIHSWIPNLYQASHCFLSVVDANSKCGGNNTVMVTSQEGYIYSPGYPTASYPPYLNCTWMVEVQPDQTLDVSFLDFQLSYTYSCDFAADFVEIGNSNRTYEYKYCDQDVPETFLSRGNRVWVHFRTGQWRNRGFWLYYKGGLLLHTVVIVSILT